MVFAAPGASAADVRTGLERGLRAHNQASPGTSARVARALVLAEPPQIDRGETTDKGYLNQRALLTHRAAEVARLHAAAPDPDVLVL
jgi:feruloyl-CoA synthase